MDSEKNQDNNAGGSNAKTGILFFRYLKEHLPSFGRKAADKFSANGKKQIELDKKLVYSLSKARIPNHRQFKYIKRFLSKKELWTIRISFLVIIASLAVAGTYFYFNNLREVPISGGLYVEGLIGAPQHVNPLYSSASDVDSDLSQLIYSSLFKRGKNGELVKDLVESYETSEDGKNYTFTLIDGAKWHDGTPVTVDDVIFTVNAIKDSAYKSPLKASFNGVDIKRIDDRRFQFVLTDPYAAFLELLTFGIIPADIWAQISPESAALAQLNLKPVGSGPYKFKQLVKDANGNVREYELAINEDYYGQIPFVNLKFVFFPSFEEAVAALNNNVVSGLSYLPPELKTSIQIPKAYNFYKLFLPQITALFFNQNNNAALGDKAVRQAMAYSIDRQTIVNKILKSEAYIVDSPILPNSFAYNPDIKKYDYNPTTASELLDSVDWKENEITQDEYDQAQAATTSGEESQAGNDQILFMGPGKWRMKNNEYLVVHLKTVERKDNQSILEEIKTNWEQIGIKTVIDVLPLTRMQEVIKTRDFDVLFYGQVLGADPDPYALWHSSQTGENGFNIANFANKEVDQLLEDARLASDQTVRQEKYRRFQEIIADEVPAIFIYSPVYTYVLSAQVKGFDVNNIFLPRDRFANINDWYMKTGKKLIWSDEDSSPAPVAGN